MKPKMLLNSIEFLPRHCDGLHHYREWLEPDGGGAKVFPSPEA